MFIYCLLNSLIKLTHVTTNLASPKKVRKLKKKTLIFDKNE